MGRKKSYAMVGPPGRVCVGLLNVRMYLKQGYRFFSDQVRADYEADLKTWTEKRTGGATTSTPTGAVPTSTLFSSKKKSKEAVTSDEE